MYFHSVHFSVKSFSRNFSWNWFHGNFHSDYLPTFCCLENYRNAARYENNMVVKMALVCFFFLLFLPIFGMLFPSIIWYIFEKNILSYLKITYEYTYLHILCNFPFFLIPVPICELLSGPVLHSILLARHG